MELQGGYNRDDVHDKVTYVVYMDDFLEFALDSYMAYFDDILDFAPLNVFVLIFAINIYINPDIELLDNYYLKMRAVCGNLTNLVRQPSTVHKFTTIIKSLIIYI